MATTVQLLLTLDNQLPSRRAAEAAGESHLT